MTLNERNRILTEKTGKVRIPDDIDHDVSMMNERQLERYIRFGWTNRGDLKLAASYVWQIPRSGDDPIAAFGRYLAYLRRTASGKEEADKDERTKVDPQVKERIDKVLTKLVNECLRQKGKPTEEHLAFSQGVVEMAYDIKWHEGGENSLGAQFDRGFTRLEKSKGESVPATEVIEMGKGMKSPEIQNPILELVSKIKADSRYAGSLKFPPFV